MQDNGHYTVQGHRFWYQSKAYIRLPISDLTNLHPISHRFEVTADYWSNLRFRQRGTPLWHTRSGWTPKLRTTKFSPKKVETLLHRMVFTYLQTIISFCHNIVAIRANIDWKSPFLKGVVTLAQYFRSKGTSPPPTICARVDRPVNALQLCRWKFSQKETL